MSTLISPEQVPIWVPGRLTVRSPDEGWSGVAVRGYAHPASDVDVPAIRDHVIIAYQRGSTPVRRRTGGPWQTVDVRPGDVSLQTSGEPSRWEWSSDVEAVHTYLDAATLASTCREMFDREIAELELVDTLKADDPHLFRTVMMLAAEARSHRPGGRLLVDALTLQLGVQLLRKHTNVVFKEVRHAAGLSAKQQQDVIEHIRDNLHRNLGLDNLARVAGLSRYHFARQFRASLGTTAHRFVQQERLARAEEMLRRSNRPLAEIAAECGFADASHLVRVFKRSHQVTPGQYRSDA